MTKNVFFTGANGGFGLLTTLSLLGAGHTVVASMRNTDTRNLDAADELRAAGAHVVELDVTDDVSVEEAVANAVEFAGSLDAVINNAGVGSIGLLETFTPADWQAIFDINVFGVQRVNRAALPFMREQGSGLLVVVSSVVGRMALPFFGPYNAAKFAVEGLAETYRSELSALGKLKSALSKFQDSLESLKTVDGFSPRKTTVSNEDLLTATATGSAVQSRYEVEVVRLAEARKLTSGVYADGHFFIPDMNG